MSLHRPADISSDGAAIPRKAFSYREDHVVQSARDFSLQQAMFNPLRIGLLQQDHHQQQHHRHDEEEQAPNTPKKPPPAMSMAAILRYLLLAVLFFTAALGLLMAAVMANGTRVTKDTLVIYIFSDTDPEYRHNMQYFIRQAVRQDDRCDYVFVIQVNQTGSMTTNHLPSLPDNARYVFHENSCYDWGTAGWLINSRVVQVNKYRYFMLLNSSVRGPFLPAYMHDLLHWTDPFLSRLDDTIKMVGPTISCEGSPYKGNISAPWRRNPHVQSYALAMDRVGLQVLLDNQHVFECHSDRWDAIWYSELGSSAAILKAGYNLDSFMIRYQGVDWRNKRFHDCNARWNPSGPNYYDGIDLDPLEVMFVKMKSFQQGQSYPSVEKVEHYTTWQANDGSEASLVTSNDYITNPAKYKAARVLLALARGGACFDVVYYTSENKDLGGLRDNPAAAWHHFVYHGQFEARKVHFTCEPDYRPVLQPKRLRR